MAAVGLVVGCSLPLQVEFVHLAGGFRADHFGDELELFAEADKSLLEYCDLSWRPSLKRRDDGRRVEKDI